MKVFESQSSAVTAATPRAAPIAPQQKAVETAESVQDKVSVSTTKETAAVDAASQSVSLDRSARTQEIINAVRSGQYYPSPQQIAQSLVSAAEVEARLRAMMAK